MTSSPDKLSVNKSVISPYLTDENAWYAKPPYPEFFDDYEWNMETKGWKLKKPFENGGGI